MVRRTRKGAGGARAGAAVDRAADDVESERSLQRMGPVSLGVSLPRSWITGHHLRIGSSVRVAPQPDGSLRLRRGSPDPPASLAVIEVGPGAVAEHLFRDLLGAYLGGAEAFEVREAGGISPSTREVVRSFVRRTTQPEVVADEPGRLRLRDVSGPSPVPLPRLVARMGQLVAELQEDAARAVRAPPAAPVVPFADRDDEVDRLGWFLERILVRSGAAAGGGTEPEGPGPLGYFVVARSLERIADHAVRIAEAGALLAEMSPPEEILRPIEQFHEQARRHLAAVREVLAQGDRHRANELLDLGEALHATGRALDDRLFPPSGPSGVGPTAAALLARLLQSVDRSVAYAQDLAEVVLTRRGTVPEGTAPEPPGSSRAAARPGGTPALRGPPTPRGR